MGKEGPLRLKKKKAFGIISLHETTNKWLLSLETRSECFTVSKLLSRQGNTEA